MTKTPVVCALLALAVWGCATNPATGRRQLILMSEQEEIQMGRQNDAEVRKQMGVYDDPALQRYVAGVGSQLVRAAHRPDLPWTFTVVDEPAVNAFALPGGFIYITRGILPFLRDEAELAGVLGHEIGHVDARHSAEAYSKQLGAGLGLAVAGVLAPSAQPFQGLADAGLSVLFLKYSRDDELEADRLGVQYEAQEGWDPHGVPALLGTLGRLDQATGSSRGVPNWALTHPPAADRVARVQAAVAAAPPGATRTRAAEYTRHLDGLVYGDSREKGIVRGNEFLHPILRFAITFPQGWQISNSDQQVTAQPGTSSPMAMLLEPSAGTGPVDQIGPAQMAQAGWQQVSGQRSTINGLDAYIGTYTGVSNGTAVTAVAAHVRANDHVYVVAGVAPTASFTEADQAFRSAIDSFRTLSRADADRIQPNRVDFYVVRPGDTWTSIARDACRGTIDATTLAIMNGHDRAAVPRAGDRIRVVVGG